MECAECVSQFACVYIFVHDSAVKLKILRILFLLEAIQGITL